MARTWFENGYGLTPAHTGNAVIGAVAVEPGGAHPRAYGERRTLQHPEHF